MDTLITYFCNNFIIFGNICADFFLFCPLLSRLLEGGFIICAAEVGPCGGGGGGYYLGGSVHAGHACMHASCPVPLSNNLLSFSIFFAELVEIANQKK